MISNQERSLDILCDLSINQFSAAQTNIFSMYWNLEICGLKLDCIVRRNFICECLFVTSHCLNLVDYKNLCGSKLYAQVLLQAWRRFALIILGFSVPFTYFKIPQYFQFMLMLRYPMLFYQQKFIGKGGTKWDEKWNINIIITTIRSNYSCAITILTQVLSTIIWIWSVKQYDAFIRLRLCWVWFWKTAKWIYFKSWIRKKVTSIWLNFLFKYHILKRWKIRACVYIKKERLRKWHDQFFY